MSASLCIIQLLANSLPHFGVGRRVNFDAIESSTLSMHCASSAHYDGLIMGENEPAISMITAVAASSSIVTSLIGCDLNRLH